MNLRSMAACIVMLAPPAVAQTPTAAPSELDCTSTFVKGLDEAALVKRFGRANVTTATLGGAEGSSERGTVLYAKDPGRRIEIFWSDTAKRRRLASVIVRGASTWSVRASGKLKRPVALKMSVGEVENANGRRFRLNGFAWDMGGYSTGWRGGKLDTIDGGCSLSVRFNPDPTIKGRALDTVSGEKQFNSSDPAILAVRPIVSQFSLDWPE